ncbi:MAG: DNA polymerase III subunit delta [Bacteroidetes bacterium]|nr:DNA polymerase III subunit delta [Bacteroidota bacterium]
MEIKTFSDVFKWCSTVPFSPVLMVVSEEHYILQQAEKILINRFYDGTAKDFNFNVLYGSETTGSEVATFAASYPMMADLRVVVVREAEKLNKEKEALTGYLKNPSQTTLLIFIASKVNRTMNPWKAIPKTSLAETPNIYENHVRPWIPELAKSHGLTIDEESVEFILANMGTNISFISAEFEKISMADIPGKKLNLDIVSQLTGIRRDWNPWELKDAIVKNEEEKAQMILAKMVQVGENPVGMVASLAGSFKSMWHRSYQLAVNKNMPPPQRYPELIEFNLVKAMGPKASRKIEYLLERLCQLDADLKGFSPFPPEILFGTFVADVCNFERRDE